jgi:hypothetical protein
MTGPRGFDGPAVISDPMGLADETTVSRQTHQRIGNGSEIESSSG